MHCCYENVTAHVSHYLLQSWSMTDAIPTTHAGRRSPHTRYNQPIECDIDMSPRANDPTTSTTMMSSVIAAHQHPVTMGLFSGKHSATVPATLSVYVSCRTSVPERGLTFWRYICLGGPPSERSVSGICSYTLSIDCVGIPIMHIYNHPLVWLYAITCPYMVERVHEFMGKFMLCCCFSTSHLISHILVVFQNHPCFLDNAERFKRTWWSINTQPKGIFLCMYIMLFLQVYGYPHIPPVYFVVWVIFIICNGIVTNASLPCTALVYSFTVCWSFVNSCSMSDCEYPPFLVLMFQMCECSPEENIKSYIKHMYRHKIKHNHRYMAQYNIMHNVNVDEKPGLLYHARPQFVFVIRMSKHINRP